MRESSRFPGPAPGSEAPGCVQPERIVVIDALQIESFVFETQVEFLADVGADTTTPHEILGLFVEFDAVVELVLDTYGRVIEVVAEAAVELEVRTERERAHDVRREAVDRRIHVEARHHGARGLAEIDVVEL